MPERGRVPAYQLGFAALSADNTALGPFQRGEGAISTARAFLIAGARSVCASTVPVIGDSAIEFFRPLYAELRNGTPPGEAARRAQMALAATGADPLHWAGWRIIGVP